MSIKIKLGNYEDWTRYLSQWSGVSWDTYKDRNTITCEPDEVLLAYYSYEDYSGDALCFYRIGTDYYEVQGGHCSCSGLEGQWDPENRGTKEVLLETLKRRIQGYNYGAEAEYLPLVIQLLEEESPVFLEKQDMMGQSLTEGDWVWWFKGGRGSYSKHLCQIKGETEFCVRVACGGRRSRLSTPSPEHLLKHEDAWDDENTRKRKAYIIEEQEKHNV